MKKKQMSRELLWTSDVDDWDKVSVESYEFVLAQAKERLDELISESRVITLSATKVLMVYITALPGLVGYIYSENSNFKLNLLSVVAVLILAAFAIYIFILLISLIAPERIFFKGSMPKDIFRRENFAKLDPESGFKNLLFKEMSRIQDKIERIQTNNKKRIDRYKSVLRVSLVLVAVLVFALVNKIFTSP